MEAYILQVIIFQLLFLLVYELLLKKETFFGYNRWYLLLTAIVSLVLPLIKIDALAYFVPAESFTGVTNVWLPEVFIGQEAGSVQNTLSAESSESQFNINWWLLAYSAGIFASLYIVFKKYRNLSRLFSFRTSYSKEGIRIIEVPNSSIACTFYNTVFLGDKLSETEREQILTHELVHVKQKHTLDLVFFEVLKIIFWFNPLVYIYQNKIATLHEFIADAAVVKVTEKRSYYEQLLNSAFNTQNISFINQFFKHSLIKKRIVMLQKSRSKTVAKLKYFALVPLMLVMLTYVACSESTLTSGDLNIEKYNYTLVGGNEKSSEKDAENYLNFLAENPDYVGWRTIDQKKEIMEFSIHSINEKVPEDYKGYKYFLPNGKESIHYVKEISRNANTAVEIKEDSESVEGVADIPFAVVDQVPVFPGCENLASNEEKKECISDKISEYVNANYDTSLGKKLGLSGLNRAIVVFKINAEGDITEVRSRASHPELEAEAIRVVEGIPKMIPGEHNGQKVGVSYALPIVFR